MSLVTVTLYVHANSGPAEFRLRALREEEPLGVMDLDLTDGAGDTVLSVFLTQAQVEQLEDVIRLHRAMHVTPALAASLLGSEPAYHFNGRLDPIQDPRDGTSVDLDLDRPDGGAGL